MSKVKENIPVELSDRDKQEGDGRNELRSPKAESRHTFKRRDMLKAMTAVPAAALVSLSPGASAPAHAEPPSVTEGATVAQAAGAYKRKALDEHEWKAIRILSDWIIPADERSGSATEAGVPEFIDDWLDFKRGRTLDKVRGGLTWLDLECNRQFHHDFADCTKEQQKQMLDRIAYPKQAAPEDAAGVAFFNEMRNLVVSGFFSSKMGVKDLPYLGNQMLTEWNGCPPEVLAKLGLK
ncbi:MAG TPA: gluconate 2-dehydrogenase subunit 3 family protein [Terriglobia bacterium]|nr:gluconate 2-dehydrogenase subunit 3 family protein [Terriglobia bacterium]